MDIRNYEYEIRRIDEEIEKYKQKWYGIMKQSNREASMFNVNNVIEENNQDGDIGDQEEGGFENEGDFNQDGQDGEGRFDLEGGEDRENDFFNKNKINSA
jgi:hypothetical protein